MGKPTTLKCATRTCTHGITLTHTANAGLNVGMLHWGVHGVRACCSMRVRWHADALRVVCR